MADSMKIAISSFEEASKLKALSVQQLPGTHEHDLFRINWEYLARVRVRPFDPYRGQYWQSGEWLFYSAVVNNYEEPPMPNLLLLAKDSKIEHFIDGDLPFQSGKDRDEAKHIVDALGEIHDIRVPDSPAFDPVVRLRQYHRETTDKLPRQFEDIIVANALEIFGTSPLVFCHNYVCGNAVLFEQGKPRLLDIHRGGLNAPIYDIASLIEENDLPLSIGTACLYHYYKRHGERLYSSEELRITITLIRALRYYESHYYFNRTGEERYLKDAERYKKRFLSDFDAWLLERSE